MKLASLLLFVILSLALILHRSSFVSAEGFLRLLSDYPEAKCLDGSPAALFYFPGSRKGSVIFSQQGGGLCTSEATCAARSKTDLGSSTKDPKTREDSYLKGFLSRNCTINPNFCDFTVFYLRYCSGDLYSGSRIDPLSYQGKPLYFRGNEIRQAALKYIVKMSEVDKYTELIYSGDSAGGFSTFVHSGSDLPFLFHSIPSLQKAAAVPLSGLFPIAPNVNGEPVVQTLSFDLMKLANTTGNADPNCMKHFPKDKQYLCSTPVVAFNYSKAPHFVLQSQTDKWQVLCLLLGVLIDGNSTEECLGIPAYRDPYDGCPVVSPKRGQYPFKACSQKQIDPIIKYQNVTLDIVASNQGFKNPYSGVFLISCLAHVAAESWYWAGTRIGGVTMHDATWKWWNTLPNDRESFRKILFAEEDAFVSRNHQNIEGNNYYDCVRSDQSQPGTYWECNPTCVIPVDSDM